MSGGSFGYLYQKVGNGEGLPLHMVEHMALALEEHGAPDAARATRAIVDLYREADRQAALLAILWHEVEWRESNDSDEETLQRAITKWRSRVEASNEP